MEVIEGNHCECWLLWGFLVLYFDMESWTQEIFLDEHVIIASKSKEKNILIRAKSISRKKKKQFCWKILNYF